jgi:hypothetical protein
MGNLTEDLYDPRSGGQAIRTESLRLRDKPFEPARTNYFSVYLIESNSGTFWADACHCSFGPASLLFFVPYQHIRAEQAGRELAYGEVRLAHLKVLLVLATKQPRKSFLTPRALSK